MPTTAANPRPRPRRRERPRRRSRPPWLWPAAAGGSLLFVLVLLGMPRPEPAAASGIAAAEEARLRAAVVVGVLRYTRWPADALSDPVMICTLGMPPSEEALASFASTGTLGQRSITVVPADNGVEAGDTCSVLVIGPGSGDRIPGSALAQPATLTICDDCGVQRGWMVSLRRQRNRIAFEVDLARARAHDLGFGSGMLELAHRVRQ